MEGLEPREEKLGSFGGFVIRTNDLKGSIDWWTNIIGLVRGYTPPTELHSQWLYIDKIPLLQLYPVPGEEKPWNTVNCGINLNCIDQRYWVNKLTKYHVAYKHSTAALGGFAIEKLQILDPNMLTVNLIFVGYDNHNNANDTKDPRLESERMELESNG
jgi:hypothetical protein